VILVKACFGCLLRRKRVAFHRADRETYLPAPGDSASTPWDARPPRNLAAAACVHRGF